MKNDLSPLGLTHSADNPLFSCNGCKNGSLNIGIIQYIVLQYITYFYKKQAFYFFFIVLSCCEKKLIKSANCSAVYKES